jgi:tetratricopeptide (TPR) repeat protein
MRGRGAIIAPPMPTPRALFQRFNPRRTVRLHVSRRVLGIMFALLGAADFPGAPALARAEQWIEVKSPNVTVTSSAGAGNTKTLAWQLEQVRSAVKTLWPWAHVDLDRRFTVLAVDNEQGMRALVPRYWEKGGGGHPASVWVSGPDQHFLAIRTDVQADGNAHINPHITAYFSYVSLILDQSVDAEIPMWLSRGLAGVLSNTLVRDSDLLIGAPIPWHLEQLRDGRRLHLPELLKATRQSRQLSGDDGQRLFDAESWAFVHYLMFGNQAARAAQLNQFFKRVSAGTAADSAFSESLGEPEDLETGFLVYMKQSIFSYAQLKVDVSVTREGFSQRTLAPAESASMRALFHVAMERPVEARAAITDARKADSAAPESHVAEGLLLDQEGKAEEATAAFTRAVSAGSTSSYAHYRLASLRWTPGTDQATLHEIEKLLARAVALNSRNADAYAMLAEVRTILGNTESLGLAIRAAQLEPSNPRHRIVVGRILLRQKRYDEALKAAEAAVSLARTPAQIQAGRELQQAIQRAR